MASKEAIVKVAATQIGVKESPSGSNKVKYAEWYGMNGQPWCAMFVSWCAAMAGVADVVGKYAYCPYFVDYFKKKGWWLDREEKPQPGDIVFFSNGKRACHVGIVEKRNGTVSVTTIEGNTSTTSNDNGGAVMRRVRKYGSVGSSWYIMGFGRPDYSKSSGSGQSVDSGSGSASTASGKIEVDGDWGKNTTTLAQKVMGTTVDGIVSGQKTACRRYCINMITNSWMFNNGNGSELIRALQKLFGVDVDGLCGINTIKGMQRFLKNNGFDCGEVDGFAGVKTVKAFQRWLNSKAK